MSAISMDFGRWALASADVEVQLIDSVTNGVGVPGSAEVAAAQFDPNMAWTLDRFQRRFAHAWVPGRVVLTSDALEFRPRQHEDSHTPLALRLNAVVSIEAISKLFTKLVRVEVNSGQVIAFRCRAPFAFAEQLQMAAGAVRAVAA